MRARAAVALLCLAAAFACEKGEEPVVPVSATTPVAEIPKYTTDAEADHDTDSLLNLAYGAAVVSRTAEATLESSAVHAIDSTIRTWWVSPPHATSETLVFSLGAPSRLTAVGATTTEGGRVQSIRFEGSIDGTSWRELGTLRPEAKSERQLADVTPVTAHYLRVTIEGSDVFSVRSLHAIGSEVAQPPPHSLDGCWRINGVPARFRQEHATITGVIATEPPIVLDGGTTGRVARLMWRQGPMWGYAAITTTPDGTKLSGLKIHEEISTQQYGDGWFGEAIPCDGVTLEPPRAGTLDTGAPNGRWSMYGLAFDPTGRLLEEPSRAALDALVRRLAAAPSQRFRVTAHELRNADPAENRNQTEKRIAEVRTALESRGVDPGRIELVARGDEWSDPPIHTALQRLLASRVDLERFGR